MRYGSPFYKDTGRLSTSPKWNIYIQWKVSLSITDNSIGKIRSIFKLRNNLVDAKPELGEMGEDSAPIGTSGQAQLKKTELGELIIDLNSIYNDTFKIDPDESKQYKEEPWLYTIQKAS